MVANFKIIPPRLSVASHFSIFYISYTLAQQMVLLLTLGLTFLTYVLSLYLIAQCDFLIKRSI